MKSYRLDRTHRVIELHGIVDPDDASAAEQQVRTLLRRCDTPAAIVDVDSALLSPSLMDLLIRLRGFAERYRVFLCVTVRHEQVAESLRAAGLERILRVTRTLSQARARTRVGCAAVSPRPPASTVRTRLRVRLYRFVCPDTRRSTAAAQPSHTYDVR